MLTPKRVLLPHHPIYIFLKDIACSHETKQARTPYLYFLEGYCLLARDQTSTKTTLLLFSLPMYCVPSANLTSCVFVVSRQLLCCA